MFERVKKALRMTSYDHEDEIKLAMGAALKELQRVGVKADADTDNELIISAVILYCWYYFNFRDDGERYLTNFEGLRDALSVSGGYRDGGEDNE